MKARKIIVCLLAGVMAMGALTACGNKTEVEDGKVTLSVDRWPVKEGEELDTQNAKKAAFEEKYPDIEIVGDTWGFDIKSFYPKAEAGLLPNLLTTPFTEIGKLIDGGYASDLTAVMKETGYYDNINPKIRELVSKDGKVYALPTSTYALGVSVNMKLFREAGLVEADGSPKQPKTWEELAEFAKIIKDKTGIPGFALCTTNNCGGWFFTNIGWAYGVDFMEQDSDGKWKATFDTPEAVAALEYVKSLKWKYDCVPSNTLIHQAEAQKLLATGQAAMILDAPLSKQITKYEMDPADYGVMSLPAGPAKHVALLGGELKCFPSNVTEEQIKAGFAWAEFIGLSYKVTEDSKANKEKDYQVNSTNKCAIGAKELSVWNNDSEAIKLRNELIEKYRTTPEVNVKLYNEAINSESLELQAEEPMCAQDLYSVLDKIIQEAYTNKDADCAALIKQANDDFQKNYLDKLDY